MLATKIASAAPREKDGARTGARYAFQAHVAFAKVLDLHAQGPDYRALFDHFDDLTILNCSDNPSEMRFYQIKGKASGTWSSASLSKASGKMPQTTIGKMYHHASVFGTDVKMASFVTNASFKFELADGTNTGPDHSLVTYSNLGNDDRKTFAKALDLDFSSPRNPDESSFIVFEVTDVPIKGYAVALQGKLIAFLQSATGAKIQATYETLLSEIVSRANDTTACMNVADVYRHKSLSRSEIDSVFAAADRSDQIFDHWSAIESEFASHGWGAIDLIKLRSASLDYFRRRANRDRTATAMRAEATRTLASAGSATPPTNLVTYVQTMIASADPAFVQASDPVQIEAAFLVEAFEALNV